MNRRHESRSVLASRRPGVAFLPWVAAAALASCANGSASLPAGTPDPNAPGCAGPELTRTCHTFYQDGSADRAIDIRSVAILPNRLPLFLNDPERWRRYNWELVRAEFTRRGISVVDYATSVRFFQESGLPLEDTEASPDKLAAVAEKLDVDAIIVPYYGTLAHTGGSIISEDYVFTGVATFQVYMPGQDLFVSRIDASGVDGYRTMTLYATLVGIGLRDSCPICPLGLGLIGAGMDLYNSMISQETRWERAFQRGIVAGLNPFFLQYVGR